VKDRNSARRQVFRSILARVTRSRLLTRRDFALGSVAACAIGACREKGRNGQAASFWYGYGGKNREVLEQLIGRFHREQSAVHIHATYQGDYYESLAKLRTSLAAGAAPALTHVVAEVVPYLADAGVLEPLDGYEGAKTLGFLPPLAQEGSFVGGDKRPLCAIPFNRSIPIMYANGDMLRARGIDVPRTCDQLREAARALTDRSRSGVGVWGLVCPVAWWFWLAIVGGAGGSLVGEDGRLTLGGDQGEQALGFWQTLVHRDRVMRPPLGRDYNAWQVAMQDFLSGRAAILWSSTAFLRYVEENARFDVKVAPIPAYAKRAVPTGGTFFVIMRDAKEKDKQAAWSFLRWMSAPSQAAEWSTGTGYLPVTRGAIGRLRETGHYAAHPRDGVVLSEIESAMPWPWLPDLFRVEREIMDPMLEDAVLEDRDPARALALARQQASVP
jgi:sn-glycerol 3-phosphate transport system substrate-binding protein